LQSVLVKTQENDAARPKAISWSKRVGKPLPGCTGNTLNRERKEEVIIYRLEPKEIVSLI
jgi:hypothetical protein